MTQRPKMVQPENPWLQYSPAFLKRAAELAATFPKCCIGCAAYTNSRKGKACRVRVALKKGSALTPENLGLYCTRCRPGTDLDALARRGPKVKSELLPFSEPDDGKGLNSER